MNERQQNEALMELAEWGCDIRGALNRLLNSKDLYFRLLPSVLTESSFDALGAALEEKDVRGAFESAHTLKGVLGNLGLTPMYGEACKAVELLRAGTLEGVDPLYETLGRQRSFLGDILSRTAK